MEVGPTATIYCDPCGGRGWREGVWVPTTAGGFVDLVVGRCAGCPDCKPAPASVPKGVFR